MFLSILILIQQVENKYSNVWIESIDDLCILFSLLSVEAIEKKLARNFDWFLETVDENHANHVDCGPKENFVTFVLPDVHVSAFTYHLGS